MSLSLDVAGTGIRKFVDGLPGLTAAGANNGRRVVKREEFFEPRWVRLGVIVQEGNYVATCGADARIASTRQPATFFVGEDFDIIGERAPSPL